MPDTALGAKELNRASSITSTSLANSYGLTGDWTGTPGLAALQSLVDETCAVSRLAAGAVGLASDDPRIVPAVRGVTAWPERSRARAVVSYPNLVGVMEPTESLRGCSSVGVVLYPDLAGDLVLPSSTSVVALMLTGGPICLTRGDPVRLNAHCTEVANRTGDQRSAIAATARERAYLLAKHVTQIAGVAVHVAPSTGRLVVTTPADPGRVVEQMEGFDVIESASVGLAEYPGGIVVECVGSVSDESLLGYAWALATVLAKTS